MSAAAFAAAPAPSPHLRLEIRRRVSDEAYMQRAITLAERGRGLVSPNPMVGAVVVAGDRAVGEGWHEGQGLPHAEIVALNAAGQLARGATLYTSLEPCCHFGRTPPCTDAIVRSGVACVVAATTDPNPVVDGRGIERLRSGGIEVRIGVLGEVAARLNEAFAKHVRTGLPLVVWKMAATLDGKVAARDGSSRWITGGDARADVHRLRAWSDAILVGAGTALADDPSLTVRDPEYRGDPPLRVLVDGRGVVPARGGLFDDRAPTLVATTDHAPRSRRDGWASAGADVRVYEGEHVPLRELVGDLGKREVQCLLLEGGPTLAFAAVQADLVDRVIVYLAPKLIGGDAPSLLAGGGFAPIDNAVQLVIRSFDRVGDDLRVEADVHRDR